jgi:hypothetical protein
MGITLGLRSLRTMRMRCMRRLCGSPRLCGSSCLRRASALRLSACSGTSLVVRPREKIGASGRRLSQRKKKRPRRTEAVKSRWFGSVWFRANVSLRHMLNKRETLKSGLQKKRPERTRSGLQNCAATSVGGTGVSRCCRRQSQMRGHRAACIKIKFTTNGRRQLWKIGRWLTEEATSGHSWPKAASPVHLSRWQWMTGSKVYH